MEMNKIIERWTKSSIHNATINNQILNATHEWDSKKKIEKKIEEKNEEEYDHVYLKNWKHQKVFKWHVVLEESNKSL